MRPLPPGCARPSVPACRRHEGRGGRGPPDESSHVRGFFQHRLRRQRARSKPVRSYRGRRLPSLRGSRRSPPPAGPRSARGRPHRSDERHGRRLRRHPDRGRRRRRALELRQHLPPPLRADRAQARRERGRPAPIPGRAGRQRGEVGRIGTQDRDRPLLVRAPQHLRVSPATRPRASTAPSPDRSGARDRAARSATRP